MDDSTSTATAARSADLHSNIRQFIATVGAAFASYSDFNDLPLPEMRRACEQRRAPGTTNNPVMAQRVEHAVLAARDTVRVRVHNPSSRAKKPALVYMHSSGWITFFSIDEHN